MYTQLFSVFDIVVQKLCNVNILKVFFLQCHFTKSCMSFTEKKVARKSVLSINFEMHGDWSTFIDLALTN